MSTRGIAVTIDILGKNHDFYSRIIVLVNLPISETSIMLRGTSICDLASRSSKLMLSKKLLDACCACPSVLFSVTAPAVDLSS